MAELSPLQVEDVLRDELAQEDAVLASARPILRHLLAQDDHALFNDEVIARVRGMMGHIARQLLFATAEAAGLRDREGLLEQYQPALAESLSDDPVLIGHAHAVTMETQLAERLARRRGLDAVLTPLVQEQAASPDPALAALAMSIIAAQARHMQQLRRMEMPLAEMPGEILHRVLEVLVHHGAGHPQAAEGAARTLRQSYVEADSRIALLGRMVTALGGREPRLLVMDHAGLALFTTALTHGSGQSRDQVVLSFSDRQFARLALSLRACGLRQQEVEAQFLFLHPNIMLPDGFTLLRQDRAQAILAGDVAPQLFEGG